MNKYDCLGYEMLMIRELSPSFELENGVAMSPKRRSFLSLIFTCLCFIKPLLLNFYFPYPESRDPANKWCPRTPFIYVLGSNLSS